MRYYAEEYDTRDGITCARVVDRRTSSVVRDAYLSIDQAEAYAEYLNEVESQEQDEE